MLRMSVKASFLRLRQAMALRWQVPLLAVSFVLLGVAFLRLRPPEARPSFEHLLDQITALHRGGFHAEASSQIGALLKDPQLTSRQQGLLYRTQAEIIFSLEEKLQRHSSENARRILSHHRRATEAGVLPTVSVYEQMGQAAEWLESPQEAIGYYRKAIADGSGRAGRLQRKIIELMQQEQKTTSSEVTHAVASAPTTDVGHELDRMLANPNLDPNDLLWAVQCKFDLLTQNDRLAEARDVVFQLAPRMKQAGIEYQGKYLEAYGAYLAAEYDQAERLLLALRSDLGAHDPLAVKAGWLLGRLHYRDGRPQEALACYQEVLQVQPEGEYSLACRLGMAESLAALQHMNEAATAYEEVAGMVAGRPEGGIIDRDAIRVSLTNLYAVLQKSGHFDEAMRFLKLAVALVPAQDQDQIAAYTRRLAELHWAIAESLRSRAGSAPEDPENRSVLAAAHDAFVNAAEEFLRLSRLLVLDEKASSEAVWRAAVSFDRANEPIRLIAVLENFLVDHPQSIQLPDAYYRLGQALQAQGRYREAVARYGENLIRYPRTPAGMRSAVPMAQCYMALGSASYPDAEKALLSIVDQPADKGLYTPEALEYREALFVLGDLYDRWGKPAKAISRLEEFLERYPQDPRTSRAQFTLANAYRRSVLPPPGSQPTTARSVRAEQASRELAERLARAEELFAEVIRVLERRLPSDRTALEELCLKHSYLYRADCAFDLRQYERALALYEEVARRFRTDPVCLSAYVQILNCYQRLGKSDQARIALLQVRWLLKSIPPERFEDSPDEEDLAYWQGFIDWIEKSGLF